MLDRNPLENIRNTNTIRYVMKNGELYEGDTLNMVWPEQKTLPKPFWWDTEPAPLGPAPAVPATPAQGGGPAAPAAGRPARGQGGR